jgi:hypothetical protein
MLRTGRRRRRVTGSGHGSSFLRDLNAGDPIPGDVTYRTFRSPRALVVNPISSSEEELIAWCKEVLAGSK